MLPHAPKTGFAAALEDCHRETLSAWWSEHGRGRTLTDAFADEVTSVTGSWKMLRGGNVSVTVTILCRLSSKTVSEVFFLQRHGFNHYVRTGTSLYR